MPAPQPNSGKTLRNVCFSGARMAVATVCNLLASIVTARYLGVRQMGEYSFFVWGAGTIAALSSVGLPDTIAKFVSEQKSKGEHSAASRIAAQLLRFQTLSAFGATVVAAALWCLCDRPHTFLILLALATVMPLAIQQSLLALMEGEQRFDLQLLSTTLGGLFQLAAVFICAHRFPSISGFVVANLVSAAAMCAFTFALCRPKINTDQAQHDEVERTDISRRVRRFSLSVYGLWLLNLIVWDKSELFFLRLFQSPSELAFYSIGFGLTARLATASESISYVLFPMFVASYTQDGCAGLATAYRRAIRLVQLVLVPVCAWGIPLANQLAILAYGAQYSRVAPVIQLLLGALLVTITMTISSNVIYAMERQLSFLRYMVAVAVANVALDLILIPRLGALGAAYANGLSQMLAAVGLLALLRRLLPGAFPVRDSVKIYGASMISMIPLVAITRNSTLGLLKTALALVGCVMTYGGTILLTRVVTLQQIGLPTSTPIGDEVQA